MTEQVKDNRVLVYRAGSIPYIIENNEIYMLFIIPSNTEFGGDRPQLAKGKLEEGEEPLVGAMRETKEETGLFLGNVIHTHEVGVFMGRTTVFVSRVRDKNMFGLPSDEVSQTMWLTMEQFKIEGRPLHVPVVQACHRFIKKLENME